MKSGRGRDAASSGCGDRVGVHAVGKAADGIGPKVWLGATNAKEVSVTDAQVMIVGGPRQKADPTRIAAAMTTLLQMQIDVRYPQTDLHPDDPVRLADPALPYMYWDGSDVVERVTVVEVTHDGTNYVLSTRNP